MNESKLFTKKIEAFTIIELVVSMLLSSIILSSVYYVVSMNQRAKDRFYEIQDSWYQLILLKNIMNEDAMRSRYMYNRSEGVAFEIGDGMVLYNIADTAIVRTQGNRSDVFDISIQGIQFYYLGQEVQGGDKLIDAFEMKFVKNENEFVVTIRKWYDSSTLNKMQNGTAGS